MVGSWPGCPAWTASSCLAHRNRRCGERLRCSVARRSSAVSSATWSCAYLTTTDTRSAPYYVASVEVEDVLPSGVGDELVDVTVTGLLLNQPHPLAGPLWTRWRSAPPGEPNLWASYEQDGRAAWLEVVRLYRRNRHDDKPAGQTVVVDGRFATDEPGLYSRSARRSTVQEATSGQPGCTRRLPVWRLRCDRPVYDRVDVIRHRGQDCTPLGPRANCIRRKARDPSPAVEGIDAAYPARPPNGSVGKPVHACLDFHPGGEPVRVGVQGEQGRHEPRTGGADQKIPSRSSAVASCS
jgi:hypothetical protein